MNDKYGTVLRSLLFDDADGDLTSSIQDTIRNAILLYEPRIKLIDVTITASSDQNSMLAVVEYSIRTSNSRQNFVYPFHMVEGTNLITSV